MFRILLGILAPLAAIFIAWSFGDLPAKSILWTTADMEITGHETGEFETGYGSVEITFPLLSGSDGQSIRLTVTDRHDKAQVEADWPAGMKLKVRLHPSGETAYPVQDSRLNLVIPILIAIGGLMVIGFAVKSMISGQGGLDFFMGGIGAMFMTLSAVLLYGLWTFGEPPATSWFWPTETVTSASSTVESGPIGNGNTNYFPVVTVTRANGETEPLQIRRNVFMSQTEATRVSEEYKIGTEHSVRIAPDGRLFERYWQFQFLLAIFISFVAPLVAFVGLFVMLGALKSSRS